MIEKVNAELAAKNATKEDLGEISDVCLPERFNPANIHP